MLNLLITAIIAGSGDENSTPLTGSMANEHPTLANFHLFEEDFAVIGVNEFRKEWRQIAKGNMRHHTFLEGMLLKSVEARRK